MPDDRSPVEILRDMYSSLPEVRAVVQGLPWGGSIDTLLVGRLAQVQQARLEHFVKSLAARLSGLEHSAVRLDSDEFAELMYTTSLEVARSRSEDKRERFAAIMARQATRGTPWEEPDAAVRMLSGLSDIHVKILTIALSAPECDGAFVGLKVVSPTGVAPATPSNIPPLDLPTALSEYSPTALRMACAELASRALLHDEGVGRWDTAALDYLAPTEVATWFEEWISLRSIKA